MIIGPMAKKQKTHSSANRSAKPKSVGRWPLPAVLVVVVLAALVRGPLLDVPLERDEGEYAYAGQLILHGVPPYEQVYNMKLPGIYALYALMLAVFGQTATGIHLGLLLVNAATIVLVFLLARRLVDSVAGLVAAACFAVLSVNPSVQGLFANAEHFVLPPALAGLLLLLKAMEDRCRRWQLVLSGLLLGTALVVKQNGAAFALLGGLMLLVDQLRRRDVPGRQLLGRCSLFALAVAAPYGLTCLAMAASGVFGKFCFWTVDYAQSYVTFMPLKYGLIRLKGQGWNILKSAPPVWILVGLGLAVLIWEMVRLWGGGRLKALLWNRQVLHRAVPAGLLVVLSFAAICPGLYFRKHYFVLLLPAAAILAGVAVRAAAGLPGEARSGLVRTGLSLLVAAACVAAVMYQHRDYLFKRTPEEVCRLSYGGNPFVESPEIARWIRQHSDPDDRVAILGSEPQIFFYSHRRSATGYIYMYPLMEPHDFALQMQREMAREIEAARPKFLMFVLIKASLGASMGSHRELFERMDVLKARHYKRVGLVEIGLPKSLFHWGPKAKWPPTAARWIVIYQRID